MIDFEEPRGRLEEAKKTLTNIGTLGGKITPNKALIERFYCSNIDKNIGDRVIPNGERLRSTSKLSGSRLATVHGAIGIGKIPTLGASRQDEVEAWVRFELNSDELKGLIRSGEERGFSKEEVMIAIRALKESEEVVKF